MDFEALKRAALRELEKVSDLASLERWRIKFLGRKSELAVFLRSMARRSQEERRTLGSKANNLRRELEDSYERKSENLAKSHPSEIQKLDISQPGRRISFGHLHPLTITLRKILEIFSLMGFEILEGPDIETEYYNFDALNIPPWHPARDMWDTLWLRLPQNYAEGNAELRGKAQRKSASSGGPRSSALLLRTHTSPMQIRYMETHQPPFRIVVPGRVFRHEATDSRHDMDFYQIEGLMVGENVSFANFKWVMEHFIKSFFGSKTELKLRASYFPFTEPSFEILMSCVICAGKGTLKGKRCSTCGGERWLEIAGAGMVHPQLFRNVGYDPAKVQGFAFGIGPDRFAMIKYKIDDIRLFRSGDLRFIRQF